VRFRLLPSDDRFFGLFDAVAANAAECARSLRDLVSDDGGRTSIEPIRRLEHRGDELTKEILQRLNSTFVTPFDREDIYALASGLDDVMDFMEEAVDMTVLYEVGVLPAELAEQVDVLQRCAELTAEAMPRLKSMKNLEEYWIEINRLENAGDKNHRRMLAKLFSGEFKTIEVLKLKDIVEALERAIDAFESVAHTVEQIAVKES
jgi:uncharacterized protein